jgi:hypothetical protein
MERHHVSASGLICFIDSFSAVTRPCRCCQHLDLLRRDLNGLAQLTALTLCIERTPMVGQALKKR